MFNTQESATQICHAGTRRHNNEFLPLQCKSIKAAESSQHAEQPLLCSLVPIRIRKATFKELMEVANDLVEK